MGKDQSGLSASHSGESCIGLIAAQDLGMLAAYRSSGWEICPADGDRFWLRVPVSDLVTFARLPLYGRWMEGPGGRLTRPGHQVPDRVLPASGWCELAKRMPIGFPACGAPGMPAAPIAIALEAGDPGIETEALLCRWTDFAGWVEHAFSIRTGGLKFARCDDERVFVIGRPLPPLRGSGFHRTGRLLIPGGHRLPDHLWPELLEELLDPGGIGLTMIHPDGSHEILEEAHLVPVTRSAVRLTEGEPLSFE